MQHKVCKRRRARLVKQTLIFAVEHDGQRELAEVFNVRLLRFIDEYIAGIDGAFKAYLYSRPQDLH
jgi:hypothetical protein